MANLMTLSQFIFDYLNVLDEKEIRKKLPSRLLDEKHTAEGWKSVFNRLNISAKSMFKDTPVTINFKTVKISIDLVKQAIKKVKSSDDFEEIMKITDSFSSLKFSLALSKRIWKIFDLYEGNYPKFIVVSRKHNTQFNIISEKGNLYWHVNILLPDSDIDDIIEEYESVDDFKKEALTQLNALVDFLQAENIEDYLE